MARGHKDPFDDPFFEDFERVTKRAGKRFARWGLVIVLMNLAIIAIGTAVIVLVLKAAGVL